MSEQASIQRILLEQVFRLERGLRKDLNLDRFLPLEDSLESKFLIAPGRSIGESCVKFANNDLYEFRLDGEVERTKDMVFVPVFPDDHPFYLVFAAENEVEDEEELGQ